MGSRTNYFDYTTASIRVYDPAAKQMLGYTNDFNMDLYYFTDQDKVFEIADKHLKQAAYPVASVVLKSNREVFKLKPGDLFKFTYAPWQISNMICRVLSIQEEELGSETIVINAIEDVNYIAGSFAVMTIDQPDTHVDPYPVNTLGRLAHVNIIDAPYELTGGEYYRIIPCAAKLTGYEEKYKVYESVDDGTSYSFIGESEFNKHGILDEEYPRSAITLDYTKGLLLTFSVSETNLPFETISRAGLFSNINLALLGTELITFQTVTQISGDQYRLTGINRSLYGSQKKTHPVGTDFFFIGEGYRSLIPITSPAGGTTRKYKFLPVKGDEVGSLTVADSPLSATLVGRSFCPYPPGNFKAGGRVEDYASYSTDVVLTWSPRKRTEGAGIGIADYVVDDTVSWEGYFRVRVYAEDFEGFVPLSTNLVRTAEDIDAATWTYTEAMNLSDNTSLSNYLVFELTNYRTYLSVEYESWSVFIQVKKE